MLGRAELGGATIVIRERGCPGNQANLRNLCLAHNLNFKVNLLHITTALLHGRWARVNKQTLWLMSDDCNCSIAGAMVVWLHQVVGSEPMVQGCLLTDAFQKRLRAALTGVKEVPTSQVQT